MTSCNKPDLNEIDKLVAAGKIDNLQQVVAFLTVYIQPLQQKYSHILPAITIYNIIYIIYIYIYII